jgi:hypothetical protein
VFERERWATPDSAGGLVVSLVRATIRELAEVPVSTRRMSSLEIAGSTEAANRLTIIDEIERGLELHQLLGHINDAIVIGGGFIRFDDCIHMAALTNLQNKPRLFPLMRSLRNLIQSDTGFLRAVDNHPMSLRGQALFLSGSELEHVWRQRDFCIDKSFENHNDVAPTLGAALATSLWTVDDISSVF